MLELHRTMRDYLSDWDSRSDCFGSFENGVGVDKLGSHVGPGETFTYVWQVLEGPSPSDSSCIPYLYYSATDPIMDTNSGLVGPLLVCKKGALGKNNKPVLFYYVHNVLKLVFGSIFTCSVEFKAKYPGASVFCAIYSNLPVRDYCRR